MFTVYKVSGNNTDAVYYGYCQGDDAKSAFLVGAQRKEQDRGDVKWLNENNGDDNIVVTVMDSYVDEFEAWCNRNELRSTSVDSFTGPTLWPIHMHRKAEQDSPQRLDIWKKNQQINQAKTAREAYQLGAWSYQQLKQLPNPKQVVKDLDLLSVKQFCEKYQVLISYKQVV